MQSKAALAALFVATLMVGCGEGSPIQNNVASAEELKSLGPLSRKSKRQKVDKIELIKDSMKTSSAPISAH